MRSITFAGQRYDVEIVSLALPRGPGLMGRGHPLTGQKPNVTLLSPKEIPLGARFTMENADDGRLEATVLGCTTRPDGRYVVVGLVTGPPAVPV
jgi:hypothetical protein